MICPTQFLVHGPIHMSAHYIFFERSPPKLPLRNVHPTEKCARGGEQWVVEFVALYALVSVNVVANVLVVNVLVMLLLLKVLLRCCY